VQELKNNVNKSNTNNFFNMNIENLYNKTLIDSRDPNIFKSHIVDNLNNKILIFLIFLSKNFNKIAKTTLNYQKLFDYTFHRIETDLREIGYGDMSVNKKMKVIVTKFYSILIDFKDFNIKTDEYKMDLLSKYFSTIKKKDDFIELLNAYFAIDNVEHNGI